ncbi:hypothetical protein PsYK624_162160 [Phanerochaete sordida]|uniref:Fibronectin type-III domain-containing protein n=1 Tax=Phanerochaete sordida TaxID=48140 RepID=A0A9P3LM16_9APHY|nr:hypothetical protein PsYK624_162160 [Phanerochaete sordida]
MRAGRHKAVTWTCAHLTLTFICLVLFASFAAAGNDPLVSQSFSFDLTPKVPITAQCDTLHITWGRQKEESGTELVAPFFLRVFSSESDVPLDIPAGSGPSFDWPVPFAPFTEYQVCMFDAANNTGGCQDIYTVYPTSSSTVTGTPNCTILSDSHVNQALGVAAETSTGPLSKTSTVGQCADISVLPTNGTPPYTLTISPTLRAPLIKTSDTMGPINDTISLSWGSSFFVSLADSSGMRWSIGPLHTGNGSTACLDTDDVKSKNKSNGVGRKMHMIEAASDSSSDGHHSDSHTVKVQIWAAAISIAGSVILGILVGLLSTLLYMRCTARRARKIEDARALRTSKLIKRKDYAQRMSVQIPSPGQPRDEDDEDGESDDELGGSTVTGHPDWQEPTERRKAVSMDSMRSAGASRENVRTPAVPGERARRPPPSSFPTNPTMRRTSTPLPSPVRRRPTPLLTPALRRPASLSTPTRQFPTLPRTPASTLPAPASAPVRKLPTPLPAPIRRLPAPPRPPRPADDVLDISAPPRFGLAPRYNSPEYMGTRPTIATQSLRTVRPLPTPPARLQSEGESAWWV